MDMSELAAALKGQRISSRYYRFGPYGNGSSDDSFELVVRGDKFEVSYLERGNPSLLRSFASEGEACEYLLEELTRDDSFRIKEWK